MSDKILSDSDHKMDSATSVFSEDMTGIRGGRASASMVEKIQADYYGTMTPIKQIAQFSTPEPRLLVVQPFDRGSLPAIEKAIMNSDLGVTPSNDGAVIRLPFPPLTEERRKELIKMAHKRAEDAKIAVRNVRRHTKEELERVEKAGDMSEDDLRRFEKKLQDATDAHVKRIDEILAKKESELKEV